MPLPDFAVLPYRRPLLPDARSPFPPKVSAGIRIWTPPGSLLSCPEVPVQYPTAGLRQNAGDLVPVLISFFSWLLLSSLFCYFSNITNRRTGSPAGIFLLCCVHFPVDANICQIGRSSRVWGIEIPGKSPTQENTIVYYGVDLALEKSPSRAQPVS